ncbi:hypothetical protein BH09MYX1_BH09MYX1_34270 [soil metagenome]
MKRVLASAAALALVAVVACGESSDRTLGLDEPIRVKRAQFFHGELPGTAPGTTSTGPKVTSVTLANPTVLPGQAGKKIDGRASGSSTAVGLRFADMGTGYWVVPTGAPDAQFPGEIGWQADCDFPIFAGAQPGNHLLRVVAIDADGNVGAQEETRLCLAPKVPDNLHACDPSRPLPAAVVVLEWDADVDLDLVVLAPNGRTVDAKHPTVSGSDAGVVELTQGAIDRDSNAQCVLDGRRQESLVFSTRPTGSFDFYANLFSACGRRGAGFTLAVYEAENDALVMTREKKGRVSAYDANGGATLGLYVDSVTF